MRLLLDENLPKRLKLDFPDHEIFTVRDKGWNGIKNGKLLQLMLEDGFHALLTFDKNLQYQQNFQKYTLTVFVLNASANTYAVLTPLSAQINAVRVHRVLQHVGGVGAGFAIRRNFPLAAGLQNILDGHRLADVFVGAHVAVHELHVLEIEASQR